MFEAHEAAAQDVTPVAVSARELLKGSIQTS
jgi:hypothetical protein